MSSSRALPAVVAAALLALLPSPARAQLWAAIQAGVYLPTGTTAYGDLQARPTATLGVGYDWTYFGVSAWGAIVDTQAGQLLQVNSFPVLVRVRARLPIAFAAPYVVGGVGVAPTRASLNLVAHDAVAFSAEAGAGVDFDLGDMFTLGVEGGWIWLKPSYDFATVDLGGAMALATFGLRF